jgi:hypothetical protein
MNAYEARQKALQLKDKQLTDDTKVVYKAIGDAVGKVQFSTTIYFDHKLNQNLLTKLKDDKYKCTIEEVPQREGDIDYVLTIEW